MFQIFQGALPKSTFFFFNLLFRQQYNVWKSECQTMVPVIGTGKFLTTPLIDDDGQPVDQSLIGVPISDKKTLAWMQTLHQIGM